METWGELFWDAWIRLRLWFRSLYRTYWPPHIKAWQICTVTGIVSVVLTLVALKYQTAPAKLLAEHKPAAASKKAAASKLSSANVKRGLDKDPFAADELAENAPPIQDLRDDKTLAGVDKMSPEGVSITEHPDPGFEPIGARKFRKRQPAGDELAAIDTVEPSLSTDLMPLETTEETAPEITPEAKPALPPDLAESEAPVEPTLDQPTTDLFQAPFVPAAAPTEMPAEEISEEVTEPVAEQDPTPAISPPADSTAKRDVSRLSRHEDSEEERHSVQDIRVAPPKEFPEPVKHAPLLTPIRSKSHYSRFGAHEDSEEDRHSVQKIRPTRVDVVLIPGRDAAQPAATELPAETELTPAVPVITEETTPSVPAQENPADNLSLPPAKVDPMEAMPMEPIVPEEQPFEPTPAVRNPEQDLFAAEQPAMEPVDEGPAPPVLFAPELPLATEEPTLAEKPIRRPREYHGPVLSTDGVDHEAHQTEDIFTRPKRKAPILSDLPEQPAGRPREYHGPVLSTDGVDHEAHQAEDIFSRPKRKTPILDDVPETPPMPPVDPVVEEPQQPVEPSTQSRTTRRAPRVIQDYDAGQPAIEVTEADEGVVPMAVPDVTRQRGPERITVPDAMSPVAPLEPTEPRGRHESAFAMPPTTQSVRPESARLQMSITGPRQAPVGTQVVWHFKIQNMGAAPATGILVSDVLPPGLQHRLSPDLEYAIDRLEPGESRETNLTVQCVTAGTITNRAVLRADGDLTADAEIQIEVSGSTSGNTPPAGKSAFTVMHHGPERWLVDSTGQFLVTVTNTSSERQRNVTICQTYPKGTNLVHATVGHKVDEVNRTVTWSIPEFAPGASYILETELHCTASGPGTSSVRVKSGDAIVAEDRWTAVSFVAGVQR